MSRKKKRLLVRILVSAVLLTVGLLLCRSLPAPDWADLAVCAAAYAVVGWDIVYKALRGLFTGQLFDENFLMTAAGIGAFLLGDYAEGVMVMLLFQLGELLQSIAVGKARKSVAALMQIRPDTAQRLLPDGSEETVLPEELAEGDIFVVRAGDRIAVDAVVLQGDALLDVSALTGESVPRSVGAGDEVLSGSVNTDGVLRLQAVRRYEQSTVARILELVENAAAKKANAERFITRFAKWYTPAVCAAAVLLAVLPPLLTADWTQSSLWLRRALTFLVVSCPCALVISVPLSFFGGIGAASRVGILIKGGVGIEQLERAKIFAFDKTGTITDGKLCVTALEQTEDETELLTAAALAESGSKHPLAQAILTAAAARGISPDPDGWQFHEQAGQGMLTQKDGVRILAGNAAWLQQHGIAAQSAAGVGTCVFVAKNERFLGCIRIADGIKPEAKATLQQLQRGGGQTVLLTGDSLADAQAVADQVGIRTLHAGLLPAQKVDKVEELLQKKGKNEVVVFIGDGINDAPVLTRADLGIAMGGIGSDAAREAADVVLMRDDLSALPTACAIAKKTMRLVRQNIVFSLGVKAAVLIVSALGYLPGMGLAVFADVGVCLIAVANAMRAMKLPLPKASLV